MEFTSNLISFVISESLFLMKILFHFGSIPMVYYKHLFTFLGGEKKSSRYYLSEMHFHLAIFVDESPKHECDIMGLGY
jgi:hypothetical protein